MYDGSTFWELRVIRNVSWAANQHIIMISEGLSDTEDWSNDAKYPSKLILTWYVSIFQYCCKYLKTCDIVIVC